MSAMNDSLQQELMEFVYGLLDEGEANALSERITSDPDVARAYAKVKLQCDLVGRAALCDTPSVAWVRPDGDEEPADKPLATTAMRSSNAYRKLVNWSVSVAAVGLIGLVSASYLLSTNFREPIATPVAMNAPAPVNVVVTGPSLLNIQTSNSFTAQVQSQAGTPVSTTLKYRLYDVDGVESWSDSTATDEAGVARFTFTGAVARYAARLEVATPGGSPTQVHRELIAAPEQFMTYLRMDRPLYQPGEPVFFRSVTLSRFGLKVEREVAVSFEIVKSDDEPFDGSASTVNTDHGVGSGTFMLPNDLPDGTYSLIVRSPVHLFPEQWRDFQVRRFQPPQFNQKLELARDSYTVGDEVVVNFFVEQVAGKPLAEVPLQIEANLDGIALKAPQAKTDSQGKSQFSLTLPDTIARGKANVSVTVQKGDNPAETISKNIPINLGKVNVDFYPEGGNLAIGLSNRVYFYGRDPLGKPTHIEGHIVDSSGDEIANVVTTHEGRGLFSFKPVADEAYRLIVDKPSGVTKEIPLPLASAETNVTLNTGRGVFDASDPIAFTLRQRQPATPLVIAAYCRGAMIGQQTIDPSWYSIDDATATYQGSMTLSDEAQGIIRLTVFDTIATPQQPIAERLVYRRVGQKLNVQLSPDTETFKPGQAVQLDLAIQNEDDAPVPAALGISIVDDSVLNLADDKSTRMPTYFHLLTEINSPEQLEDANFYLSDEPDSDTALDTLLGTQGWRRFVDPPVAQYAQAQGARRRDAARFGGGGGDGSMFGASQQLARADWFAEQAVPLATEVTLNLQETMLGASPRSMRTMSSRGVNLAWPIILTSIALLGLVAAASLRRSIRILAATVALASLVIGITSLPRLSALTSQVVMTSSPPASEQPAAAEEADTMFAGGEEMMRDEEVEFDEMAAESEGSGLGDNAAAMPSATIDKSKQSFEFQFAPNKASHDEEPNDLEAGRKKGRAAKMAANEKQIASAESKDKKEAAAPAAAPMLRAAASPDAPLPAEKAMAGRGLQLEERLLSLDTSDQRGRPTREYADWFYAAQPENQPTNTSSATIFWHPLFIADDTGKATIYFNLPQRASRFRAIVEAHGGDRLGAGELIIDSK
jgi:hypothetical protein